MLKEIEKNLNTQNNRATANPIFIVYDWEKVPSCSGYTDEWEYISADDGTRIGDTIQSLIDFAHESLGMTIPKGTSENDVIEFLNKDEENVRKFYYIKKRVFINVFFTEKSADDFIKQNNYHYTKEVHTYVNCLWRNPEMQYIRDCLKKGLFKLT